MLPTISYFIFEFSIEIFLFICILLFCLYNICYLLSSKLSYLFSSVNTMFLSLYILIGVFFLLININVVKMDFFIFSIFFDDFFFDFFIFICILLCSSIPFFHSYNSFIKFSFFEFYIFLLLLLMNMFFLFSTENIIIFFVLLELHSVLLYFFVFYNRTNIKTIESSIRYFILSSFSSLFFLFGICIIYGLTCLTDFSDLSLFLTSLDVTDSSLKIRFGLRISLFFILVGFFFKLYIFPFNLWVVDVYENTSLSSLFIISCLSPLFYFYLFFKFYLFFFSFFPFYIKLLFSFFGMITFILGVLGGLNQTNIKKIIAYSSISNFGSIMFLMLINDVFSFDIFFDSIFLYILGLMTFFFFLFFFYSNKTKSIVDDIKSISFFYKSQPILCIFFFVSLFSLSSFPPLFGFLSKFILLFFIFNFFDFFFFFIFFFFSLINIFYYFKLLIMITFSSDNLNNNNIIYDFNSNIYLEILIFFFILIQLFFVFFELDLFMDIDFNIYI